MIFSELKLRKQWLHIEGMIYDHFQDPIKCSFWMHTKNPHLGGTTPAKLITMGRYRKLLKWIKAMLEENKV